MIYTKDEVKAMISKTEKEIETELLKYEAMLILEGEKSAAFAEWLNGESSDIPDFGNPQNLCNADTDIRPLMTEYLLNIGRADTTADSLNGDDELEKIVKHCWDKFDAFKERYTYIQARSGKIIKEACINGSLLAKKISA